MNKRLTIATSVISILLVVVAGVFVMHSTDMPVEEVKIYELPDPQPVQASEPNPPAQSASSMTNSSVVEMTAEEIEAEWLGDSASDMYAMEPCCPEASETAAAGDTALGQAPTVEYAAVSSDVIEDGRLHAVYWDAHLRFHDQVVASKEAMDALLPELNVFVEENRSPEQIRRNMSDPAYRAKAAALLAKLEALEERDRQLANQLPIELSYVH